MEAALKPWKVLTSREVFAAPPWIKVLRERVQLPDGRLIDNYHRIVISDCVIVFAETDDHHVIVERQYKHGPRHVGLSLPAGAVEEGEEPLAAARRELLEETGYSAREWCALGSYTMNGNYGCGVAHMYKATGAKRVKSPDSGDLETIEILLVPRASLRQEFVRAGTSLLGSITAVLLGLAHSADGGNVEGGS